MYSSTAFHAVWFITPLRSKRQAQKSSSAFKGYACQRNKDGKTFERIAWLRCLNGCQQCAAEQNKEQHRSGKTRPAIEAYQGQNDIREIDRGIGQGKPRLCTMLGILPPAQLDPEQFRART